MWFDEHNDKNYTQGPVYGDLSAQHIEENPIMLFVKLASSLWILGNQNALNFSHVLWDDRY